MKKGELIRFLGGYKNFYNKLKDIKRNDPCLCNSKVHKSCLDQWRLLHRPDEDNFLKCEICKTDYVGVDILPPSPPFKPPLEYKAPFTVVLPVLL